MPLTVLDDPGAFPYKPDIQLQRRRARKKVLTLVVVGVVLTLVAACAAPTPTPTKAAPAPVAHKPGEPHPAQPKNLEAIIEIDMFEYYFANPQGEKNPTFKVPAGKTIGIHLHNEGTIVHELMLGRKLKQGEEHGYEEILTEIVPVDLFLYYGDAKVEIEDAKFSELEVAPGIRDIWIRITIPPELKGEWEIGCFVEGHYEAGMLTKLIVE